MQSEPKSPAPKSIVALHGSYFLNNFGDVLLLSLFSQWIKKGQENVLTALPLASKTINSQIEADKIGIAPFLKSRLVVFGGGGYFGEPPEGKLQWNIRNYLRHAFIGNIAIKFNKPVGIFGVGVGPLSYPFFRNSVVNLCSYAKVLAVRDPESKDYLINYGINPERIITTSDAAISMEIDDIPVQYAEIGKSIINRIKQPFKICVHIQMPRTKNDFEAILINELINFTSKNPNICILWISDHPVINKYRLLSRKNLLPDQSYIIPYTNPWVLSTILGAADLVFTTKLHVGIISTALGTPAISIPFHTKVVRFYKQIQAEGNCIPINTYKKGMLSDLIDKNISDHARFSIPVEVKESARLNKALLQTFLESHLI